MSENACRLYLLTPPRIDDIADFKAALSNAPSGGDVACLQIRLKDADGTSADDDHIRAVTRAVLPVAQEAGIAVLINDRPDLAQELGADGVHIGQKDGGYAGVRKIVGPDAIVGVTCHASRHLAFEAAEAGADYVAFGAFFATATKMAKSSADLDLIRDWAELSQVPCVAIGGISPKNARPLVQAGADFLCASASVWNHPDGPGAAVAAFNKLFADTSPATQPLTAVESMRARC